MHFCESILDRKCLYFYRLWEILFYLLSSVICIFVWNDFLHCDQLFDFDPVLYFLWHTFFARLTKFPSIIFRVTWVTNILNAQWDSKIFEVSKIINILLRKSYLEPSFASFLIVTGSSSLIGNRAHCSSKKDVFIPNLQIRLLPIALLCIIRIKISSTKSKLINVLWRSYQYRVLEILQ